MVSSLAAGTTWVWTSERLTGALDVLFVDEAGQMSLANVVAMGHATDRLMTRMLYAARCSIA